MTKKLLALVTLGFLACGVSTSAANRPTEEVTVDAPYTIREQTLSPGLHGRMQEVQISVETSLSFADLDRSNPANLRKMRQRIRRAAVENCRELNRRFPPSVYVRIEQDDCVRNTTLQALAQLDEAWARGR